MITYSSRCFSILLILVFLSSACFSQQINLDLKNYKTSVESPYRLDKKKDLAVGIGSAVLIAGGTVFKTFKPGLDSMELYFPDTSKIPSFDIKAIHEYDNSFLTLSNVMLYTAMAMPFLSFVDKRVSGHAPQITAMYLETLGLSIGLYSITTGIVNRRRPLTFNTDSTVNADGVKEPVVPLSAKQKKNVQESFFSGHTSTAAAATFFGARVFTDFRPHSKLVPFVWGAAVAVPAFVGYSRVQAGKHFPTDVITGYAVGAAIGYLVPTLHKIDTDGHVSLSPMMNGKGFAATYTF